MILFVVTFQILPKVFVTEKEWLLITLEDPCLCMKMENII